MLPIRERKFCFQKVTLWRAFSKKLCFGCYFHHLHVDESPIHKRKVHNQTKTYVWTMTLDKQATFHCREVQIYLSNACCGDFQTVVVVVVDLVVSVPGGDSQVEGTNHA